MSTRAQTRPNSAFTLIEMIISGGIMSVILVSAYVCLNSGLVSQRLIEARADAAQTARVALNLISADLRGACPLSDQFDFLGMQRTLGDVQADNLDFATHNYTPKRPGEGDYCQVSYFLEKDPRSENFVLWRRRNPVIGLDPLMGGNREEIARGVRGIRFEYYDGYEWYDQWGDVDGRGKLQNSLKEHYNLTGLPEAVRITLQIEAKAGKAKPSEEGTASEPPLTFQTVARLNLAGMVASKSSQSSSGKSSSSNTSTSPDGGGQ